MTVEEANDLTIVIIDSLIDKLKVHKVQLKGKEKEKEKDKEESSFKRKGLLLHSKEIKIHRMEAMSTLLKKL